VDCKCGENCQCGTCKCGDNCQCGDCKVTLGYWAIQGLAQPIRYLLELTGVKWHDKQLTTTEEWTKDKTDLKFDFPNLPYLITCGRVITESSAIFYYIPIKAKQPQLLGGDEFDRIKVTQLLGVIGDVKSALGDIAYAAKEDFEKKKGPGLDKIVVKLALLEKFLGKKDYLMGYLTVADIMLFYYLDQLNKLEPKRLEPFTGLLGLHTRVADIKQIKEYRASDRFPKYFNSPLHAAWSG